MENQQINNVEIWCDGSFRQEHKISGIGYVIRHADGHMEQQALTLPRLRNSFAYGSQIAELAAVTYAMNAVPAHSHVLIHMDCKQAIESLQAGTLTFKTRRHAPALLRAFQHAAAAMGKLCIVAFEHTRDNADPRMSKAHQLSRSASAPITNI